MFKKALITLIVFATFIGLYFGYMAIKRNFNYDNPINPTEKEAAEKKIQYRLAYNDVQGNKTQTIALNKGAAVFEVDHKGDGEYLFLLKTTQGDSVLEIAKGKGDFSIKKTFEVPQTTAYLLEVLTSGNWSFKYR
jgi:hypothetical protein